ncbi:hypothetical protein EAE99_004917 [Botrytis elliptica]|nr:hypothetical protein EAE99_004917 [Botrytis elliptica]
MSARIGVDLNLSEHIVKYEPVNVVKLAELSGAEELLLKIILRPLSSTNFVKEVDEETWGLYSCYKSFDAEGSCGWSSHVVCLPSFSLRFSFPIPSPSFTKHQKPLNSQPPCYPPCTLLAISSKRATPRPQISTMASCHTLTELSSKVSIILVLCLEMCLEILIHLWEIRWERGNIGWIGGRPVEERVFEWVEGADNALLVDVG